MGLGSALCLALWTSGASAANIGVTYSSSSTAAPNLDDGKCDIVEAVQAANLDTSIHTGDCVAGSGADSIVLTPGATYLVKSTLRLQSDIAFTVSGGGRATIKPASSFTVGSQAGGDCMIYAEPPGATNVTLSDLNLDGNGTIGITGFGSAAEKATVKRSSVTGFQLGGLANWCEDARNCTTSSLYVSLSEIVGNVSPGHGGGIFSAGHGSSLSIDNSLIANNTSEGSGGGIFFGGGPNIPTIRNSTISGNWAFWGGGIQVDFMPQDNTYLQIFGTTIANNTAQWSGGGIYFLEHHESFHDIKVNHSIVTNNSSGDANHPNVDGGVDLQCYDNSLIYVPAGQQQPQQLDVAAEQCRFDVADAKLGPLMDMGGNGVRLLPLLPGSPAIDAGINIGMEVQQRDTFLSGDALSPAWQVWNRNVDGNSDGVARKDIGAFEFNLRWQMELLKVKARGTTAPTTVVASGWDRGAGQRLAPANLNNAEFVTYVVPIADTASRTVTTRVKKTAQGGKFRLAVASSPSGPWTNLSTEKDTYAATDTFTDLSFGTVSFPATGPAYFRFTATGTSHTGYELNLDFLGLTP